MSSLLTDILTVNEFEGGMRLDKMLAERLASHSRTYIQFLIENDSITLNRSPVKKRSVVQPGDEINITFLPSPEISLKPEAIPLDILYEDEDLIVVNKPVGMVVHPAPGNPSGTFVNALLHHCKEITQVGETLRPGIVHRLDKETSGVLLAAKTRSAHQGCIEQFSQRKINKEYIAVVIGKPSSPLIDAPIGRHKIKRKQMAVLEDGKEAITECELLAHSDGLSLVKLRPKTGRTHQLRVHMQHINTPILGDPIYGSLRWNQKHQITRPLLHAQSLQLTHPIQKSLISFFAPMPSDILRWDRLINKAI